MKQRIQDLINRYLDIVHSPRNQNNKALWRRVSRWNRDMWRGIPIHGNAVPFTIAPDNSLWARILNVDLRAYYSDPEKYLETQLLSKIYSFEHFNDNTYFTDELYIWFGVITELSFFNTDIRFFSNKEGWINGNVIDKHQNLKRLELPDFRTSGLMPTIHHYYDTIGEYANGKLNVMFPEWVRGPFCIAAHLRGIQNFLMDLVLNPEFVHNLMRFIVDSNKHWNQERNKYLKTELKSCKLYNDEIDSPTISPRLYQEFIFPYEKELADHYGEVAYWHSCGNTSDFLDQLNQLTNLRMYHCGPWTSYKKAAEVLKEDTAIDICLNPYNDILSTDESQMKKKLQDILQACSDRACTIRADGFMPGLRLDTILDKIARWNQIALSTLSQING